MVEGTRFGIIGARIPMRFSSIGDETSDVVVSARDADAVPRMTSIPTRNGPRNSTSARGSTKPSANSPRPARETWMLPLDERQGELDGRTTSYIGHSPDASPMMFDDGTADR
jgi:hypothetical protein